MSKVKKALERAKKHRMESGDPNLKQAGLKKDKQITQEASVEKAKNDEINVSYTKTKILDINPNKLKENKVFSHIKEHSMTDQINILRTQILNKLDEINGNTLMVTSAHPGEGKTFTSINLGVSIAQEFSRTVLLVDCDLRQPDVGHFDFASDFFGVKIKQGLSDYLLGQLELEDVLLNPGIGRLTILPAGKSLLNSAELLSSPRMKTLVEEMKTRYGKNRIIIFDSPSILNISDPLAFSRFVDGILLVVEANKSSKEDILRVMNLLNDRTIIGTVFNKVKQT